LEKLLRYRREEKRREEKRREEKRRAEKRREEKRYAAFNFLDCTYCIPRTP